MSNAVACGSLYTTVISFVLFFCNTFVFFRPVTPSTPFNTTSHRVRNLPCTDISNREYSSSIPSCQRAKYNRGDVKQDGIIEKDTSPSVRSVDPVEVQKRGRQHARRSLHYDNNENIIDDATTEYVFSRKRPISPESLSPQQPRKRCRTEDDACVLESLDVEPLVKNDAGSEHRSPQNLSAVIIGRKSGQWKVSTPTRERTLTPRRDGTTLLDTPSKSVTFHDSVFGGDSDHVNGAQTLSLKRTPRSGRRTPKISLTPKLESSVESSQSGGKVTPRARRSICLTPKSGQKGTPGKTADAKSSPADVTPRRSSARIADAVSQLDNRRQNKATPRTEDKKKKDLPVRRLLSESLPGTGRVLRPRTPRSYKFRAVDEDNDNLYNPDVESSDEEEFAMKGTPSRKARKEVQYTVLFCAVHLLYMLYLQ